MAIQAEALRVVLKQFAVSGLVSLMALFTGAEVITGVHVGGTVAFENPVVATQADVTGWELQLSDEEGAVGVVALDAVGLGIRFVEARFIRWFVVALKADGGSTVYQ